MKKCKKNKNNNSNKYTHKQNKKYMTGFFFKNKKIIHPQAIWNLTVDIRGPQSQ